MPRYSYSIRKPDPVVVVIDRTVARPSPDKAAQVRKPSAKSTKTTVRTTTKTASDG